jgi:hypothetical protein
VLKAKQREGKGWHGGRIDQGGPDWFFLPSSLTKVKHPSGEDHVYYVSCVRSFSRPWHSLTPPPPFHPFHPLTEDKRMSKKVNQQTATNTKKE